MPKWSKQRIAVSPIWSKINQAQNPYSSIDDFERDVKLMVGNIKSTEGSGQMRVEYPQCLGVFLSQARKADTLLEAWLRSKAGHKFLFQGAEILNHHIDTNTNSLAIALLLIEPLSASLATSALNEELKSSLKLGKLPRQNNRIIELYRVLAIQVGAREALGFNVTSAPCATNDVNIDAPKLLECIWKTTKDDRTRKKCTRSFLAHRL